MDGKIFKHNDNHANGRDYLPCLCLQTSRYIYYTNVKLIQQKLNVVIDTLTLKHMCSTSNIKCQALWNSM